MNADNDGEAPLAIPNLQDLLNTFKEDSDSQELLGVFSGPGGKIADNLKVITDTWLTEASEEKNAA